MTNSSLWEQENQEKLRDDYFYRCAHGIQNDYVYPIRRIICEGCGNLLYYGACQKILQRKMLLSGLLETQA